jgi:phosphate uptake regulator
MIGTEITSDSMDGLTIQVLLSLPELSVESALRRMFLIALSMHRDAVRSLLDFDRQLAQAVIDTDDEVDRFSLYIIRQLKIAVQDSSVLKQIGLQTARECLGYRLIVKSVERVADHASQIARNVLSMKKQADRRILALIAEFSNYALKAFEESSSALFKRSYETADKVVEEAELVQNGEDRLLSLLENRNSTVQTQALRLVVEHIKRTAEYSGDIAEIVLNLTAEQTV